MNQLPLVSLKQPPQQEGIDLRLCDVTDILTPEVIGQARLVMSDPPWSYSEVNPRDDGTFAGIDYGVLSMPDIASHHRMAARAVKAECRMLVWTTFPMLADWMAQDIAPMHFKSGLSWHKQGGIGQGYHLRGDAELALMYTKGATGRPYTALSNSYASPRTAHSEKPVGLLRRLLRSWTQPGDLVVDMYAGLAPMARACLAEGRSYVGAEIDPQRHADAMTALAQRRGL